MRQIFSVVLLVLMYNIITFGQAQVDIPLSGTDGTTTINLAVGLDPTATSCIDPALGESDLPPFPPFPVFDIRFDLSPVTICGQPLSSLRDIRLATSFPYSGQVEHVMWFQTQTSPALPINITYNLPVGQAMTLKDQIGGGFFNTGQLFGSGTVAIPGSYTAVFNKCLCIMDYDAVPVELTSFTGIAIENGVMLNWATATEINNQGFDVERKSNIEQSWERLGFVEGNGTTTEPQTYSYLDENVPNGSYTYRLKQIDFSGAYEYSPEVVVNVGFNPTKYALFQNYPNPFNPNTSIQFQAPKAGVVTIKIYDMLGQEIKVLFNEEVEAGMYTIQWDGINDSGMKMSSGSYIYRMTAGDFIESKEMILLK